MYFHSAFRMSMVKNAWVYILLCYVYSENIIYIFKLTCYRFPDLQLQKKGTIRNINT